MHYRRLFSDDDPFAAARIAYLLHDITMFKLMEISGYTRAAINAFKNLGDPVIAVLTGPQLSRFVGRDKSSGAQR